MKELIVLHQTIILYPADYFNHDIADDLFEQERQIANELGIVTALFDFDTFELFASNDIDVNDTVAIYRGWQLPTDDYENRLFPLLSQIGTPLVSPQEYANMHTTDNYIDFVNNLMLPSITLPYAEIQENPYILYDVSKELGSVLFVKDGIKSVHGHTCIFFENYDEQELNKALDEIEQIRMSRGQSFTETLVFKPFVEIDEQMRAFIINRELGIAVPHDSEWAGYVPYSKIPMNLPSPFYTVDLGHDTDSGEWFVVECGDGQVSDIGDITRDITKIHELYTILKDMSQVHP